MIQSLRRITYGRTTIPESWMFAGGDENKKIPIILSVFLIETGDMKILVDAGCNTMPGFELTDFVKSEGVNNSLLLFGARERTSYERHFNFVFHCGALLSLKFLLRFYREELLLVQPSLSFLNLRSLLLRS